MQKVKQKINKQGEKNKKKLAFRFNIFILFFLNDRETAPLKNHYHPTQPFCIIYIFAIDHLLLNHGDKHHVNGNTKYLLLIVENKISLEFR